MRSKTEVELELCCGILSSMFDAIEELERFWPPSRRGSNAQRCLDAIKEKRKAAMRCAGAAMYALDEPVEGR